MESQLLNFKQALKYLNINSYHTLYKFINNGLSVTVIGSSKRISKTSLDQFIDRNTNKKG